MKYIVYKISNTINKKFYFGVTQQTLEKRWQQHKCNSSRKNYHLYNAIKKYGFENFKIEIVFNANSKEEMFKKEIELIKLYQSNNREYGYNNSNGGDASRFGCKLTNQQKNKISEYQKNRLRIPFTEETKIKMSKSAKGRDMSIQVKLSAEKRKGKPSHNRVKVILNDAIVYESISEASIKTGISIGSIHNNIKGLSKKTKKGIWRIYEQHN
jgi:group I intron endonuclease